MIKFYCDVIVSSTPSKSSEIGYYLKISSVNHKSPDATRFSPHTLLFRLLPAASANNAFVQVDLLSTSRKSGSHQNGFRRRWSWFRGRTLYNGRLDFKIQELWVVIWVLRIWKAWIPPRQLYWRSFVQGYPADNLFINAKWTFVPQFPSWSSSFTEIKQATFKGAHWTVTVQISPQPQFVFSLYPLLTLRINSSNF